MPLTSNVESYNDIATDTVATATEDIDTAKAIGVDTQTYVGLKDVMKPEYDEVTRYPSNVDPVVAESMGKNKSNASIIKPDSESMNTFTGFADYFFDTVEGKSLQRDVNTYYANIASGVENTEDEEIKFYESNDELLEQTIKHKDRGIIESGPGFLAGQAYDLMLAARDNAGIIGGVSAASALAYGTIGLAGGIPGAIGAGIGGGISGLVLGGKAAFVYDTYYQGMGQVYGSLVDAEISEVEKKSIAQGAGVLMGAVSIIGAKYLPAQIPWLNKIIDPKKITALLKSPAGKKYLDLSMALGKSFALEGGEEVLQETVQIIAENMGKHAEDGEAKFIEGLIGSLNADSVKRLGTAGALGGIGGAAFTGTGIAVGKAGKAAINAPIFKRKGGEPGQLSVDLPVGARPLVTDLVGDNPNLPAAVVGTRSIHVKVALEQMSKVLKDTDSMASIPDEMDIIRQRKFESRKFGNMYVNPEDLKDWSNSEEKGAAARAILDKTGVAESQMNSPIRLDAYKAFKLVDQFPEISEIITTEPGTPTFKEYMNQMEEAGKNRAEFLGEIPERTDRVTPRVTKEDILNTKDISEADRSTLKELRKESKGIQSEINEKVAAAKLLADGVPKEGELTGEQLAIIKDYTSLLKEREQLAKHVESKVRNVLVKYHPDAQIRLKDQDIFNEQDYLNQEVFTPEMLDSLPEKEVGDILESQRKVRTEVAEAIKADETKKMNKVVDIHTETELAFERELQADTIDTNEDIKFIEDYLNPVVIDGERVGGEGPIHQIHPDSLTNRQKSKYSDDVVLGDRQVFSNEGSDVKVVAKMFNMTPDDLLKKLANTPTKEQAIETATENRRADIEDDARRDAELDDSRLAKAYNKSIKNHLKELKVMVTKEWPAFKKGVKRIAFPLPKIESLINEAKIIVGGTKIKELNVNQHKVGERKSNRKAMTALLANKMETAFTEKSNAAKNASIAKETHIAIGKVNKAYTWLARLGTKRTQAVLQEAGPVYKGAVDDLLSMFSFDKSTKQEIRINNYQKYVDHQLEQGNGDHSIPLEVGEWLDTAASGKDLTVDQLLYVTGLMKSVVKQARMKNKLLGEYKKEKMQMSEDLVAGEIRKHLSGHHRFDPKKLVKPVTQRRSLGEIVGTFLNNNRNLVNNIQFQSLDMDQGQFNGFMSKVFYQALAGVGSHEGKYGLAAKTRYDFEFKKRLDKAIETYGKGDFLNLGVELVNVAEFKNSDLLNNGQMTKLDLLVMQMHMGNPENRARLENYDNVDLDAIEIALRKHLTKKDFDFVQDAVWDNFGEIAPKIQELEYETKGVEMELTTPLPFEAFGKVYRGGHMPLKYRKDASPDAIADATAKRHEAAEANGKATFVPPSITEGIVRSNHTKLRVGSEWAVSLDYSTLAIGFDEISHDLAMRVPVRDSIKLATREDVRNDITSVLGIEGYERFINGIAEQTNSVSAEHGALYASNNRALARWADSVEVGVAVAYIAFNPSSVVMASLGMPQVISAMGPNGYKHLAATSLKLANPMDYGKMKEFFKFAAELDPSLATHLMGFSELNSKVISEANMNLPKTRAIKGKTYNLLKRGQARAQRVAFHNILNSVDVMMKTTTALGAYAEFMAGDAPGFSKQDVMNMTPAEAMENAKGYVAQLSAATLITTSSLEKAAIQKNVFGKRLTNFWNERRSALNMRLQNYDTLKMKNKKMMKHAKEGNYLAANLELAGSATLATRVMLMTALSNQMIKFAREMFDSEEDEEKRLKRREASEWLSSPEGSFTEFMTGVILEGTANQMPVIGDLAYTFGSSKTSRSGRSVSVPLFSGISSLGAAAIALPKLTTAILSELQLIDAENELTSNELRNMMVASSIFMGGIPVNGPMKIYKGFEQGLNEPVLSAAAAAGTVGAMMFPGPALGAAAGTIALAGGIDYFVEKYDESPNTEGMSAADVYQQEQEKLADDYQREQEGIEREPQSVRQLVVDQAKAIRGQITPISQSEPLNKEGYEMTAMAVSEGDWTKVGANGEAGIYQFTEEKWNDIMNDPKARSLNLTENGRVSKDQGQQQRAMKFESTKNAALLAKQEIAVNLETLLYAHIFGIKDAKKVWTGSPKTKLSKEMKADPRLKEAKVKNAGDMRKYIEGLL